MERFEGGADPARREALDGGAEKTVGEGWREYRKTTTTWARKMKRAFIVDTLEGPMQGNPGDYLAVGAHGEMYPIKADIFDATMEQVDD